jgi:hypothetical protein
LILILVLIFMPKGLLGILTNVKNRLLGSKYLLNPPSLETDT